MTPVPGFRDLSAKSKFLAAAGSHPTKMNTFKLSIIALFSIIVSSCNNKVGVMESAATNGNSRSQYQLYKAYVSGDQQLKIDRDTTKAHYWLEEAASNNNFEARQELIKNLLLGHNGYEQSKQKATSLAMSYGNSFKYPLIENSSYYERLTRDIKAANDHLATLQSQLNQSLNGASLSQKTSIYTNYLNKLGSANFQKPIDLAKQNLSNIDFVNYLNSLELDGVKYQTPSKKDYQSLLRVKADLIAIDMNLRNKRIEWETAKSSAQSSIDMANSLEEIKYGGSNPPSYGGAPLNRPPRSGYIIPGTR